MLCFRHVKSLSLILLTHATTSHLAAYAHCCKYFPGFTSIPVYATAPVKSLGRALLQDIYFSNQLAASSVPRSVLEEVSLGAGANSISSASNILLQPPTADEITSYFNLIHPLKYSQPHEPESSPSSPPLNGLTITAYSAGHSLGGTIWHIQHGLESIVYAVDWNQAKDSALQAAAWLGAGGGDVIENLRRPTALVCSSRCSQRLVLSGVRESRDEEMIRHIKQTIARGGSVLIPSDTCARSLELAYFLEESWNNEKPLVDGKADSLRMAKLYFASASGSSTMRYARSMLEWMDQDIIREFEALTQAGMQKQQDGSAGSRAPFDFRFLKVIERKRQLEKLFAITGPKVILATDLSLEWGYARKLFEYFSSDERNLIILSEPLVQRISGRESLGASLWRIFSDANSRAASAKGVVETQGLPVTYVEAETKPLEGDELLLYQQYLARERQRQWKMTSDSATTLREDVIDDSSSSSSEESIGSGAEQQGKALNISTTLSHARHKAGLTDAELGIEILIRKKGHYDYDVRGKKGRDKMYPVLPIRRNQKFDDYGEVIRPEDYLRAEEREHLDGHDQTTGKEDKDTTLGRKRKWNEPALNGDTAANGILKKRKQGHDSDFDDGTASLTLTNGADFDDLSETEGEDEEGAPDGPVKAVFSPKTIPLNIRIAYVDFSGLHDKRSMQMLIPLIRPRKLVLIGGDAEETNALKEECEKLLGKVGATDNASEIFTPVIGQTLNASVDTNAWNVKLSIPLRRQLHWQVVGGLGVVPLTSHLKVDITTADGDNREESKAKRIKGDGVESTNLTTDKAYLGETPVLDVVPTTSTVATRMLARPLHVGDLRLSDLRKVMQALGLSAEFRGEGTLLINGLVAVRKSAIGRVEVETVIGMSGFRVTDQTFEEVRKRIYASLAVISGS
jgi:cleavage and polyadenylation specificity factor subunit 2